LWESVNREFVLAPHESELLRQACKTVDVVEELQAIVAANGLMVRTGFETSRPHPVLPELRAQQASYARLVKALKLPLGVQDDQARGSRARGS
jgi:hypothetical protein